MAFGQFVHPGIFSTQQELEFIKARASGVESHPMKSGYETMKKFYGAALTYTPAPEAQVTVVASGIGPSEANFRDASHAAFAHAMQWVITGNDAHKDKAIEICNAWSKTFRGMSPADQQRRLEAAWVVPTWAAAAEIVRYYNQGEAGWSDADISRFCGMLDTLYRYVKEIYDTKWTNNWGSSAALVGVFENDTAKYRLGKEFYEYLLPYQVEKTGLLMETCRDCNHAEYNIIGMLQAAEIAWKQGDDLYGITLDGQSMPRLLMGMEFHANALLGTPLNVGQPCGPQDCSSEDRHAPGWEIGRNHYKYRTKLDIPATERFVTSMNRPVGTSEMHFTEWSTLTHAELGDITSPSGSFNRILAKSGVEPGKGMLFYQKGSPALLPLVDVTNYAGFVIMNLQGKRVAFVNASAVTNGHRIALPGLPSGTYLFRPQPREAVRRRSF
jgi:hypothetical protein